MSAWKSGELDLIGTAEEVGITSPRDDGSVPPYVTIWVVRVGDDLYVRSYRGEDGAWYRHLRQHGEGRVRAGDLERDVVATQVGDDVDPAVDEAYRAKYAHHGVAYIRAMTSDDVRATTLRLLPR